jgi:hypothetical protein
MHGFATCRSEDLHISRDLSVAADDPEVGIRISDVGEIAGEDGFEVLLARVIIVVRKPKLERRFVLSFPIQE